MKNAVRAFLLVAPSIGVANTLPDVTERTSQSMELRPIEDSLEKSTSEFPAQRCASFTLALEVYRQIMRSNPVYGRNQDAGAELNWIDDVENWYEMNSKESVSFVGEYMDAFGPVTVPTKITKMPLYVSEKGFCLNYLRERP